MSFGKSPDDYRELAGAAHATLLNARKACGDGDALTLNISSLHHVLSRLSAGVEASEKEGGVRKREGDNRWRELATLARECARLLKVLNQVLGKYNSLPNEKKKVTKLWRKVKFGNGEILDLDKIQHEMGAYTQAITLFLGSVERGEVGEVEGYMDTHGAELREVKHTLHWVIAKMLALEDGEEEGILKGWRTGMQGGTLPEVIKEQLANEGWASKVLTRHQKTIEKYIVELGERGVLDATEVALNGGHPPVRDNSSMALNKSGIIDAGDLGQDTESDSEPESSLDEEDGVEMPLGRRRSSTVSAEKRPDVRAILPSRKRSLDEMDTSEESSEDERNPISHPALIVPKSHAQYPTPIKPQATHAVQYETLNSSDNKLDEMRSEVSHALLPAPITLSISNLPPLPVSRPRSRTSDNDSAEGAAQPISTKMDTVNLPQPHSTAKSVVHSRHTSTELFSSQTLSISSLPPLPISRPRSRNSDHSPVAKSAQLPPIQTDIAKELSASGQRPANLAPHYLGTTSERLVHANQTGDTSSDESSESEEELAPSRAGGDDVGNKSLPHINVGSYTIGGSQDHSAKASVLSLHKTQDLELKEARSGSKIGPSGTQSLNPLSTPLPTANATRHKSKTVRIPNETQDSDKGSHLSKSDILIRPSMAVPMMSSNLLHNRYSPSLGEDLVGVPSSLSLRQSGAVSVIDNRKGAQPRTEGYLQPKHGSSLRAINSESSIARPQIQRTTNLSYANVVMLRQGGAITPNAGQVIVDDKSDILKTDQTSQSQLDIRDEFAVPSTTSPPSLTEPSQSAEYYLDNDSSGDESEQSYLIIDGTTGSQVSFDEEPESGPADVSQTESMENIIPVSNFESEAFTTNTKQKDKDPAADDSSNASVNDIDGQGYMNAWSVILSHVSDDHESSLLETSDIWAQSNAAMHPASLQKVTKEPLQTKHSAKDTPGPRHAIAEQEEVQSRSRNVTLVGDSDDEPRPPKANELWPEGAPQILTSIDTSIPKLMDRRVSGEGAYESGTDGSITVPGDSDNEPFIPMKPVALVVSGMLPAIAQKPKKRDVTHSITIDSDYQSSDDANAGEKVESRTKIVKSPTHDVQYSRTVPNLQFRIEQGTSIEPVTFREIDYQPESRPLKHRDNKTSELGPHGEAKKPQSRRNRSRSKGSQSAANRADESWSKEVESRMEEYQMQVPSKARGATAQTPASSVSSTLPVFRQIASFGSSNRSWWWTSNKTARARYQPTIEDVNDEDSLPGAHPNCWSNDSEEFSQVSSGMKSATDLSGSMQKESKPHVAQYLNPFRENSALKSYRIGPGDSHSPSGDDDEASYDFPSSSDDEDIRRYRSGKEIVYEDPDLSFNSGLDESSDSDDESKKAMRKQNEATAEQKEAFKKGIKADRYRKKRYRLEKGKEAVWGSASEREERRKARSLRKKVVDLPKITGGRKTVTFEINGQREARFNAQRPERPGAKLKEMCRAYIEDVRDEDFLPGAHPNCETASGSSETGDIFAQQDLEASLPVLSPVPKARATNASVSPSKSAPSSRQSKGKRPRNTAVLPLPDDDKDEDLRRYRREETAPPPQEDTAPAWRSTRAYRSKKSKQRRFSHGEDEKFWDDPSSLAGDAAGSSEDDWGETYRSDNSRNSSVVGMGGCTCCVQETQPKRRRQHYRSPPVIHHPELNPVNPFLPAENTTVAAIPLQQFPPQQLPQQHSRRRSSIDPWSPDPPSLRRHRREKTSENPTYHVPDAPAPVLNSTRPELPVRRRTENAESSPQAQRPDIPRRRADAMESVLQAQRPDLVRRRIDAVESMPPPARPEIGRRTIRTAVREHSPTNLRPEQPKRRIESGENPIQEARPDMGRRLSVRKQSPTRPDMMRRRTDAIESAPQNLNTRPEINRRRTVDRELSPVETRPEMSRRMTVDKEHKPREKFLRFDIK